MTQPPAITTWPAATRERVAAAIIDAALPTCAYRFEQRDGAWTVTSSPEPPTGAEGEQWVYPPDDVVLDFLEERLGPALELLKMIYGIEDEPTLLCAPPPARKPRTPTLQRRQAGEHGGDPGRPLRGQARRHRRRHHRQARAGRAGQSVAAR